MAFSSDGNTALIGGPDDEERKGAAWLFTRSGSTWTQQGEKLTGGGERGRGIFGFSVALSAHGNTALIGGPEDHSTIEVEAEVTENSRIVKGLASTTEIPSESEVSGVKIPPGTTVRRAVSETEVELSSGAEGAGSATVKEKLTFDEKRMPGAAWIFTRSGST